MIMSQISETGHAKNTANAKLVINYITQLGTVYQPSNADIEVPVLKSLYQAAYDQMQIVNISLPQYKLAAKERALVFSPIIKKLAKLRKAYKSTKGVTKDQLELFMTISRKFKGVRKKTGETPASPETEQNQHSVAQTSYDQRANTFSELIELLQSTPNYTPNEVEYQITTLQNEKNQMMDATDKVGDTFFPLSRARTKRNEVMYTNELNLVDTFNTAKDYISTILNTNSPEYKAIAKLKFKKQ
jgi:hypothetical protein